MSYIIGIDPGSRITGFGVLVERDGRFVYENSGCIRTQSVDFPQRLKVIFEDLTTVITAYPGAIVAIERVFVNKNVDSALKLGQARGAAICACVAQGLPVAEYSATEVKQALTGSGRASKEQMQHMIRLTLGLNKVPQVDAADALAIALCHGHATRTRNRLSKANLASLEI